VLTKSVRVPNAFLTGAAFLSDQRLVTAAYDMQELAVVC
jgi:hypothetical protein